MFTNGLEYFSGIPEKITDISKNKTSMMIFYTIIVLGLLYFLHNIISNGLYTVKEGYTNGGLETLPQNIKNLNNDLQSSLLIQSKRQNYEDTIIALDDAINLHMLRLIKENAGKIAEDSSHSKSKSAISEINEHLKLKEALNDAIKYLDQQ
jgi:hypothetical protein|tara:strand:- start:410 stop:862 length:453 start_codon:yes stop_codon:yes gene_type:complete